MKTLRKQIDAFDKVANAFDKALGEINDSQKGKNKEFKYASDRTNTYSTDKEYVNENYPLNDIRHYSKDSYNDYGWTVLNKVLSPSQVSNVLRVINNSTEKKNNILGKSVDGYDILCVDNRDGVYNNLVYINSNGIIDRVIKLSADTETELDSLRRIIKSGKEHISLESLIDRGYIERRSIKTISRKSGYGNYEIFKQRGNSKTDLRIDTEESNGERITKTYGRNGKIKSADPVTYDDNGNIIPLSQ